MTPVPKTKEKSVSETRSTNGYVRWWQLVSILAVVCGAIWWGAASLVAQHAHPMPNHTHPENLDLRTYKEHCKRMEDYQKTNIDAHKEIKASLNEIQRELRSR